NVLFDTIGRDVRIGDLPVQLPRRECTILEILLRRQGRVVPRSVLEERLYGIDDEVESNAVPVHVHHLRRRLQEANATAEIHTVRGIRYLLAEAKKCNPSVPARCSCVSRCRWLPCTLPPRQLRSES